MNIIFTSLPTTLESVEWLVIDSKMGTKLLIYEMYSQLGFQARILETYVF